MTTSPTEDSIAMLAIPGELQKLILLRLLLDDDPRK